VFAVELDVTMPGLSKVLALHVCHMIALPNVEAQADAQKIVDAAHEICP
jgi:hypothetical protein